MVVCLYLTYHTKIYNKATIMSMSSYWLHDLKCKKLNAKKFWKFFFRTSRSVSLSYFSKVALNHWEFCFLGITFRRSVDHVTIFSSNPMEHRMWSSGNSWKLLLTVVTESFVLNVTGLLSPTLKHVDTFSLSQ